MPVNEGKNCSQCHDTEDCRQCEHLLNKNLNKLKIKMIIFLENIFFNKKKDCSQCHDMEDRCQGEDLFGRI